MRVENVDFIKSIPQKQQPYGLKQGEMMVSEVVEVKGQAVLLRNQIGVTLTARILGDLSVFTGDFVETVVDQAGNGRYVLRVLDISRPDTLGQTNVMGKTQAPEGSQSMSTQTVHDILAGLKKNPGVDPKTVEFLVKNGMPDTSENVETLSRIVKGEQKIATLLTQIQNGIASAKGSPAMPTSAATAANPLPGAAENLLTNTTAQALPGETVTVSQSAGGQSPSGQSLNLPAFTAAQAPAGASAQPSAAGQTGASVPSAQTPAAENAAAGIAGQNNATDHSGMNMRPLPNTAQVMAESAEPSVLNMPGRAGESHNQPGVASAVLQAAVPDTDMAYTIPNMQNSNDGLGQPVSAAYTPPVPGQFAGNTEQGNAAALTPADGQPAQWADGARAIGQLISMFVDMKDTEKLAKNLKKAVNELPNQVKELKYTLDSLDNNDKDTFAQKFEHVERQMNLMSDAKRFDCYHVPLMAKNQTETTAELYVYRQRNKKSSSDPENFVVLLGLDTQNLGRVEAMIKAGGQRITLDFRLEQMKMSDVFSEEAKSLKPVIEAAGFQLANVSVAELAAATTLLTAEEVLSHGSDTASGNLDIRI